MEERTNDIELYPGNWLNNASIIGFLISLQRIEQIDIQSFLKHDGRFVFPKQLFSELKVQERYFDDGSKISSIVAKAPIYRNYLQPAEKELYCSFVTSLHSVHDQGQCDILTNGYNLPDEEVHLLKAKGLSNFMERITNYNMIFHADLGPSLGAFPNAYWNLGTSNKVCHLFAFLVIHQHLAFKKLADKSELFINAPSFKLMFELNRLLGELIDKEKTAYKNLLAMSIVEFSIRTNLILHAWAGMDIEIVAIKNGKTEYINLPYETVQILSNKKIAELISSVGDFKILNLIVDQKWDDLVDLGYRLLKISMSGIGKEDSGFLNQFYFNNNYRSERELKELAKKLFKLYSLITERIKYHKHYE